MQSNLPVKYFLILGIFMMLIFITWFILLTDGNRQVVEDIQVVDPIQFPSGDQDVSTIDRANIDSEQLYVATKSGAPVAVLNFLSSPEVEQYDDDVFLVKKESGNGGSIYEIFYFRGGGIGVSLLDVNLQFSRDRVETALSELLGLSLIELCALRISVTVPAFVSQQLPEDYSGIDFGISPCPGALPLNF